MERNKLICVGGLVALLLAGCAPQQSRMEYIGADTAKRTALEMASLSEQDVSQLSTDMNTREGLDYYQVSFEAGGKAYQYEIDALTGVVISGPALEESAGTAAPPVLDADTYITSGSDSSAGMTAVTPGSPAETTPAASESSADVIPSAQNAGSDSTTAASGVSADSYIGVEEAKRYALEHAGLDISQVAKISADLELEHSRWVYDVEFDTTDGKEYDYEIDAYSGAVLSYDYDAERNAPQQGNANTITAEQAQQLALDQVPGAAQTNIQKFKTDYDDGALRYEGKILYDGMEYKFEIDAYSGLILEWSAEPYGR
ncbi:MAG: PepSY domain-containing protein [Lachnospiraceae bacterium]|nr:PepSY domain-containing protein [Lachnospiraceae bacterium]